MARQVGASTLDGVERSKLAELARRAGARFIVNGTIVQAGSDLRIDARVEDLTTGAVRVAETVRGPDALALADDLSARVRRGLDVKTAPGTVRKVADVAVNARYASTDAEPPIHPARRRASSVTDQPSFERGCQS